MFLYFYYNANLSAFFISPLLSAQPIYSSQTIALKSTSPVTEYLVGIKWFKLTYFTKGFMLVFFIIFFLDILLVTLLGQVSRPATRAWGNFLCLLPSSQGFTITAFLPAYLPLRRTHTLPYLRNFTIIIRYLSL